MTVAIVITIEGQRKPTVCVLDGKLLKEGFAEAAYKTVDDALKPFQKKALIRKREEPTP